MKEILKITASLTIICIAAALVLGAVFAWTEHTRKENEEKGKKEVIEGLLGFGSGKETPDGLKVYSVHRYVVNRPEGITLGYVVPLKDKKHALVEVDMAGKPGKVTLIDADEIKLADRASRDAVVIGALGGARANYAETFYVANKGDARMGYVVPGVTQGFKTFIDLMVSMDPEFTVTGIEITKSEEDPGLGDEIKRDFFKNQFKGKSSEALKGLKVVKEPLPDDYLVALDPNKAKKANLGKEQLAGIREKHLKDDIYALTGATISTKAVTTGVKDTVRKFVYRLDILNEALKKENVQAVF